MNDVTFEKALRASRAYGLIRNDFSSGLGHAYMVVSPDDDAREATRLMAAKQVRRLPVLEGGKVVGMVSLGDLAQCRQFDMEASKALCEISDQVKHGYVE